MAQQSELVRCGQRDGHTGGLHRGRRIDAELLGDRALHFGDADFEHDLLTAADLQHVDNLGRIARKPPRDVLRAR